MRCLQCFLIVLLLNCGLSKVSAERVTVVNGCSERLLIRNEKGKVGPFFLNAGETTKQPLDFDRGVIGPRIWGLAGCSNEAGANCKAPGPYQSLAEFHWEEGGKLFFDVSQVDGYTLPITMTPYKQGNPQECTTTKCKFDLNQCPVDLRIMQGTNTVACKQRTRDAASDYSALMNRICPDAYAWSQDDQRRPSPMRFSCNPDSANGLRVTFC